MTAPLLLAFDLDRTLLTEDFRLPREIERAIFAARDVGHHVTILTGRPLAATSPYLEQLHVTGPFSVNHGGVVYGSSGELVRRLRLESSVVSDILRPYLAYGDLDFSCVVDEFLYVRDPDDDRWAWAHTRNRMLRRFDPNQPLDADKLVFAADPRTERIESEISGRLSGLLTYLWGDGFLEIVSAGADKGSALALIAEMSRVPRSQVVAFGDGLNDVSMLEWAGHAVAVGEDAHPEALARSDEIIERPEDGGVARWLAANLGVTAKEDRARASG